MTTAKQIPIESSVGKQYLAGWEAATSVLIAERAYRLRNMTDEQTQEAILAVFSVPIPEGLPPRRCGLIEQQAWFKKLHSPQA